MRGQTLWCVCALGLFSNVAVAQRLSELAPGTLIRLSTRAGARIVGPLAEVRADTVFVSTTVQHPAAAVPLASVVESAFADGFDRRSVGRAAWIGAGIGAALAYLAGRGETDDFRLFSSTQFRLGVTGLGALIGFKIGVADASPHWVAATVAGGRLVPRSVGPPSVGIGLRF